MKIEIDDFVLDNLFFRIEATEKRDRVWWRQTTADKEGYILIWEDGKHFHTYRHPFDWYL